MLTDDNDSDRAVTSFFFLGLLLLPFSSSEFFLLLVLLLLSLERAAEEPVLGVLLVGVLPLLLFLYVFMNSEISSGQSRFFSGSQVLCFLQGNACIEKNIFSQHQKSQMCFTNTQRNYTMISFQRCEAHANTKTIEWENGDLLREAFPLEEILYTPFYNSPVQNLLHHIFFLI